MQFLPTLIGDYANAKKSYKNIMLSIQYHSHFEKMEAVFSAIAPTLRATHPSTLSMVQ